jgi:uncharacterized phage-associated protein
MYNSYQIANYFIKSSQDTGQELTPMKLIKLCYIAHGWHLGLYDTQLLDEVIYAWKYGPVVDTVYKEFRKYGSSQIAELYSDCEGENIYPMPDEKIKPFLDAIWKSYSKYDGVQLSAMTHQSNTPWDIIWNKKGGNREKYAIIPNDLIKAHYKEKIQQVNANTAGKTATA